MKILTRFSYFLRNRKNDNRLLIVHAKESWFESVRTGKFDFFLKIEMATLQYGIRCKVVRAESQFSRKLRRKEHIHLILGEVPDTGERALHVMPSYVWGFWYLDRYGVHAKSSIGTLDFQPSSIEQAPAEYFFNGVSGHMLRENISKFPQAKRLETPLETADVVVFLQQIDSYKEKVHFVDTRTMISVAAKVFKKGRVFVKAHPAMSETARADIVNLCESYENITLSDASVHDLIAASSVVLTQNSAAGFEALMQKKPVVTCAKTDYWHATSVARSADELADKLESAAAELKNFPYEKYLYWFLHEHNLEPQSEDFEGKVLEKLQAVWPGPFKKTRYD